MIHRMEETEVLVVGAGPTGLTLATLLRRAGIDCLVIDKADGPSTTSKAIGLQYRVSEVLAWMGLVDRFVARAAEQTTVNLIADPGSGRVSARLVLGTLSSRAGAGGFAPRPIIIPQSDTEAILGEALREAGGSVAWSRELVDVVEEAERVVATLADGTTVRARWLVSCEGAHSVARKRRGISFDGKTYPHDFIMADVAMDTTLARGEAFSFLHPRGVLSAITMPGEGRWRLFIEAGETHIGEITLDAVRALFVERTGDRSSVISAPRWLTRFKIHSRIVERFRDGRVFLAGDAAHLHSPSGGQGITTGMQDATNLAWKLVQVVRHGAPEALLDTYDEERRPAAQAVLRATDANTRRLFAEGAFAKWFRNRIFIPMLGTAFVQRRLVGRLSQLDVGYRAATLARAARATLRLGGVHAGDRAPDVALGSGENTLFRILGEGKIVALVARADSDLAERLDRLGVKVRVLGRGDAAARRIYGSSRSDLWLVRPDGYVLLRCRASEREVLRAVLARVFAPSAVDAALGPRLDATSTVLHRVAIGAVCIQFAALVRTLAEIVRLRATLTLEQAMPFVVAALVTSVMAWLGVMFFAGGRVRTTTVVAALTVAALVAIKAVAM